MATINWKKATSNGYAIFRNPEGCVVVGSYVDGDETILLTLPISCLQDLAVIRTPTSELEEDPLDVTYDQHGHDAL